MDRSIKSAEEIQAEVTRLVHQIKELHEDRQSISIPMPGRLIGPDSTGCNWYMAYGRDVGVHGHAVQAAVQEVKAKWNLEP